MLANQDRPPGRSARRLTRIDLPALLPALDLLQRIWPQEPSPHVESPANGSQAPL